MSAKHKDFHTYALEMTGIFVVGLGSMILLVIGAWFATLIVAGTAAISEDAIGNSVPAYEDSDSRFSYFADRQADNGQVAGVVAEASTKEASLRNSAVEWLGQALVAQGLEPVYRDGVLDRNAQNQAVFYADQCSLGESNWSESIGLRVDEGYTTSFSEASFWVSGVAFASELPSSATDYARLFTLYDAVGVGVAELPAGGSCEQAGLVMVFHLASVRS